MAENDELVKRAIEGKGLDSAPGFGVGPGNIPPGIKSANSNTISDAYRDLITISYRYIGDVPASTEFDFFGHKISTPIMAGPTSMYERANEASMFGYAKAVAEAGSIFYGNYHYWDDWQKILDAGLPAVRVIKPLIDMDLAVKEIEYDTEHGALAYATDIDHGYNSYGINSGPNKEYTSRTVEELKILNDASPLPFILKGVISVRDAKIAAEVGVAGIVISGHNNHHPCTVPPLRILPEIRAAVGDKLKIFVDGGINTGVEAFKALALGADGTLSARALLGAFSKDGPQGVTNKIKQMTEELRGVMVGTASPDLKSIDRDTIYLPLGYGYSGK